MESRTESDMLSVEEYLQAEQRNDIRREYIGGTLFAKPDASDEHIALSMNLAFALRTHLQGGSCKVQMSEILRASEQLLKLVSLNFSIPLKSVYEGVKTEGNDE
jgi:Uma2 family endonuclease